MPRPIVPLNIPAEIAPSTPSPRPPLLKDSPPLGFGAGSGAGFQKMSNIANFFTEIYKFISPAEVALYTGESGEVLSSVQKAWWQGRDPNSNKVALGFEANSLTERVNSEKAVKGATKGYLYTDWLSIPIDNKGNRTDPYHDTNSLASASGRHYGHWHRMSNFSDDPDLINSPFGTREGAYYEQTWNGHAGVGSNVNNRWLHAATDDAQLAMADGTAAEDNFQTILAALGKGEWTKMNTVLDGIGARLNQLKREGKGYVPSATSIKGREVADALYGQPAELLLESEAKDGDGKTVEFKKRFDANYFEAIQSGAYRTFSDEESYYFLLSMTESFFRFFKAFREVVGRIEDLPSTFDPQWSLDPNFVVNNHSEDHAFTTGSPTPRLIENLKAMFNSFFGGGLTNISATEYSGDVNPEYFSIVQQFLKPLHSFSNIMQIMGGATNSSYSGEAACFANFKTFALAGAQRFLYGNKDNHYQFKGQGITRFEQYLLDAGAEDYHQLSRLYLAAGGKEKELPGGFGAHVLSSGQTNPGGAVNQLLVSSTVVPGGTFNGVYQITVNRQNGSNYTYSFASKEEIKQALIKVRDNINQYWRFSPYNAYAGPVTSWGTNSTLGVSDLNSMLGNGLVFDEISSRGAAQIQMDGRDYSKSGLALVGTGHFIGAYNGTGVWRGPTNVSVGEERLSALSQTKNGVYNPIYAWGTSLSRNLGVDGYITLDKLPTPSYGPNFDVSWGESRSLDSYLAPVDQARSGWSDNTIFSTTRAMFQNYLVGAATQNGKVIQTWNSGGQSQEGNTGFRAAGSQFKGVFYDGWNTSSNPLVGREWMATLFSYLNDSKKEGLRRFSYTLLNNLQESRRYEQEQEDYFAEISEEINRESESKRSEQRIKQQADKLQAELEASLARAAAISKAIQKGATQKGSKKKDS